MSLPETITIDGLSATGKGTTRSKLAQKLGFHELDSGALYRVAGLKCNELGVLNSEEECAKVARNLNVVTTGRTIIVDGVDRTVELRSSACGKLASIVGQMKSVRESLHDLQLSKRQNPGLVTDGRDQGFVFDTPHRFVLVASEDIRAKRRQEELAEDGNTMTYEEILKDMKERDHRDMTRAIQPYKPHPEAFIVDTSHIGPDQVVEKIIEEISRKRKAA